MKLKPNISIAEFLNQVKTCKGEVYFETHEKDLLNLKSKLSQYVFLTICYDTESNLFENGRITCARKTDMRLLEKYLL